MNKESFAVLVDVGCDWPEVVFVGRHADALQVAREIPDEIVFTITAVIRPSEAIAESKENEGLASD
jgi:hypothetical protein